jgi:hypothetical protein
MTFKQCFIFEIEKLLELVCLLALFAIALVTTSNWEASRLFLTDDLAFCLSLGRQVAQGEIPMAGLPSHAGARHFTSAYLWLLGAIYKISFGKIENIFLWFTLIKISALATFCWLWLKITEAETRARTAQLLTLGILLSLLINSHYLWLIRFEWVNNLMPSAGIFNLLCFSLLMFHGAKALPLYIFGSLASLGFHLGILPILFAETLILTLRIILDHNFRANFQSLKTEIFRWYNLLFLGLSLGLVISCLYYEVFLSANIWSNLKMQLAEKPQMIGFSSAAAVFMGSMLKVSSSIWIDKLPVSALLLWALITAVSCIVLYLKGKRNLSWLGLTALTCCLLTIFGAARQIHVQDYFFAAQIPFFWLSLMLATLIVWLWLIKFQRFFLAISLVSVVALSILSFRGYLHYQNFFSKQPQPNFLSLEHVNSVAEIINRDLSALNSKEVKIFVTGEQRLRRDAYYYLINSDRPDRFHYSRRMKEFAAMQREKTEPNVAYLINCSSGNLPSLQERIQRSAKTRNKWTLARELDLNTCSSCGNCKIGQLAPINVSAGEN